MLSVGLPSALEDRSAESCTASRGVMALNTDGSAFNSRWTFSNWATLAGVNRLSMVVPGRMVNMVTIGSPPKSFS